MESEYIEKLLEQKYIVVDILPEQVSANSKGRFFAVEQYFLKEPHITQLHRKFLNVILKLYCYYSIVAFDPVSECELTDPVPEQLEEWIVGIPHEIYIFIKEENTLITLAKDDIYMTVYSSADRIISLTKMLADSEGLFVR